MPLYKYSLHLNAAQASVKFRGVISRFFSYCSYSYLVIRCCHSNPMQTFCIVPASVSVPSLPAWFNWVLLPMPLHWWYKETYSFPAAVLLFEWKLSSFSAQASYLMEMTSRQDTQKDHLLKSFHLPVLSPLEVVTLMEGSVVSFVIHTLNSVMELPKSKWIFRWVKALS